MAIEVNRRGLIIGLTAVVAAPAVIRVTRLMPISTRFVPLYVPVNWLEPGLSIADLKSHAWPRPLGDTWVDINDHDPSFVRQWVERIEQEPYWGIWG